MDVTFQQANHPSGIMLEGKFYFSEKHQLYGFKTEVSVTPSSQADDVMAHKPQLSYYFGKYQNPQQRSYQIWKGHINC